MLSRLVRSSISGPASNSIMTDSAESAIDRLIQLREDGVAVDAVIVSADIADASPSELLRRIDRNGLAPEARMLLSSADADAKENYRIMGFDGRIDQPITEKTVFSELRDQVAGVEAEQAEDTGYAPAAAAASNVVSFARPSLSGRVLVVDDNEANRKLVATILSNMEIVVDTAVNGAEAVEMAGDNKYCAILMDMQMPVLNGYEATRRIRAKCPNNATTPILALTAGDLQADEVAMHTAGVTDFLQKPVEVARLRSKIELCVEASKERRSIDDASGAGAH